MKEIIKQIEKLVDEFMQEFNCYNPNRIIFPLEIEDEKFTELYYKLQNMIKELFQNRCCENCKFLKVWVEKQGELKDNIYCCNYAEYQDIKNFYCSEWEAKK